LMESSLVPLHQSVQFFNSFHWDKKHFSFSFSKDFRKPLGIQKGNSYNWRRGGDAFGTMYFHILIMLSENSSCIFPMAGHRRHVLNMFCPEF
jgi:hypothetical protein